MWPRDLSRSAIGCWPSATSPCWRAGATAELVAGADGAKLMLLGGAAMDGPRHIWWNFVSSTKERIEVAKADWREGRFAMVPGDPEFIPLPDR